MGVYERRVFPWLNDVLGGVPALKQLRRETLASATGEILEIGFGSGANLPFYPAAVTSVAGLEPNEGMSDRARSRVSASPITVRLHRGIAEDLPFGDGVFDAAVSTLTLCSVGDARRTMRELRRVVRPGGAAFILEHGLSPDPVVARRQERWNGVQRIVACGCNLNRPVLDLIAEAGFVGDSMRSFFVPGVPRIYGWLTVGRAIRR